MRFRRSSALAAAAVVALCVLGVASPMRASAAPGLVPNCDQTFSGDQVCAQWERTLSGNSEDIRFQCEAIVQSQLPAAATGVGCQLIDNLGKQWFCSCNAFDPGNFAETSAELTVPEAFAPYHVCVAGYYQTTFDPIPSVTKFDYQCFFFPTV